MTIYSAGLRSAEAASLRVENIDSDRMMIRVVQGKGRKDRYVPLSLRLLDQPDVEPGRVDRVGSVEEEVRIAWAWISG